MLAVKQVPEQCVIEIDSERYPSPVCATLMVQVALNKFFSTQTKGRRGLCHVTRLSGEKERESHVPIPETTESLGVDTGFRTSLIHPSTFS